MALWLLALNDCSISVYRDGQCVDTSPGIAVVDGKQIYTGNDAAARQHLVPRGVHSRFWQQLNETRLVGASRLFRHHADLAYHHLAAVLERCGHPDEAVVAVPAHYGNEELGLLLGICEALKLKVASFVDLNVAALAACAGPGRFTVADIHLHHGTLVTVDVDRECARSDVQVLEQCGLQRITDASVDLIADAFLEQSRFDPLHEAEAEQLLHERLPGWLASAATSPEIEMQIEFHNSRFKARLAAIEFERVISMVLAPMAEQVERGRNILVHERIDALAGASRLLRSGGTLSSELCARAIAEHRLALHHENGPRFVTTMPATATPTLESRADADTRTDGQNPTHVLHNGVAVPFHRQTISLSDQGVMHPTMVNGATATLECLGDGSVLRTDRNDVSVNGSPVNNSVTLHAGDRIEVGNLRVTVIFVADHSES